MDTTIVGGQRQRKRAGLEEAVRQALAILKDGSESSVAALRQRQAKAYTVLWVGMEKHEGRKASNP